MCLHESIDEEVTEEPEEMVFGTVDCKNKLNVREAPSMDAEIVHVLVQGTEVMIDHSQSTDEFYSVCTESGIEGFCMKKFIAVHQ